MIKLIVKDDNKTGIEVHYRQNKSNTIEHIAGMCALYKTIKACTDLTDEEIFKWITSVESEEKGDDK